MTGPSDDGTTALPIIISTSESHCHYKSKRWVHSRLDWPREARGSLQYVHTRTACLISDQSKCHSSLLVHNVQVHRTWQLAVCYVYTYVYICWVAVSYMCKSHGSDNATDRFLIHASVHASLDTRCGSLTAPVVFSKIVNIYQTAAGLARSNHLDKIN